MNKPFLSHFLGKFASHGACLVLMYHRIGMPEIDHWNLSVSPECFEGQVKLMQRYAVISVDELYDILSRGKRFPKSALVLTFDDGYADNFSIAAPVLRQYGLPATFFITTNAIGSNKEFWWDALERILYHSLTLPGELLLDLDQSYHWTIPLGAGRREALDRLFFGLNDIFRLLDEPAQRQLVTALEAWSGNGSDRAGYLPMNLDQLLSLQHDPMFTLAAHTQTHPFLPILAKEAQHKEIRGSSRQLEDWIKMPVSYFAYPHGGRNQDTIELMTETGMKLAFHTEARRLTAKASRFELPRIQVLNQSPVQLEKTLTSYFRHPNR